MIARAVPGWRSRAQLYRWVFYRWVLYRWALYLPALYVSFSAAALFGAGLGAAHASPPAGPPEALSTSDFLPREEIDPEITGVSAFANDLRFGSIRSQFREVRSTLRLRYVRVLFAWNDDVQPSPNVRPNFSFYDDIARSIPRGVTALVVLTGVPSWMNDPANWIDGNPRRTFAERWVRRVVRRYRENSRLGAYQIWNEPNDEANGDNTLLGLADTPAGYLELLAYSRSALRRAAPRKRIVSAATTAINQNFPETIEYNQALLDGGIESLIDVWAAHYYGGHLENLLRPGGVLDLMGQVSKPIWITESGEQGTTEQLEYVEQYWPLLRELVPSIRRFYLYQFTEDSPADETYGLRNLTPGRELSDLYIWLRDRP